MLRLTALFLTLMLSASVAMADEVVTIRDQYFCSVHDVNFGTRTFDCVDGAVLVHRWICEFEGEVTCRREDSPEITRTFANPFSGHICRRLCKPE